MIMLASILSESNDLSKLEKAEHIATLIHSGAVRRGNNDPYIMHPMRIRAMADLLGYDEDTQVVAYLHDTIEDTLYKDKVKQVIVKYFGVNVLNSILLLTHEKNTSYTNYLFQLAKNQSTMAEMAFRVKMLDMLDNVRESPSPRQKLKYKTAIEYLLSNGIDTQKIPDIIIIELGITA